MATAPDPNADFFAQLAAIGAQISTGGAGAVSSGNADDPPVYWGPSVRTRTPSSRRTTGGQMRVDGEFYVNQSTTDERRSLSSARAEFYGWSDAERQDWADYLVSIGYLSEAEAGDYYTLLGAWNDVIGEAVGFTAAGKTLTPREVAQYMASAGAREAASGPFSGRRSATSRAVDLTDPVTAKALVNRVLSDALGREANPEELRTLRESLAAAERSNPTVQTTTTDYQDGIVSAQSSTTSGGLTDAGRGELLREQAMAKPEYGAYQAASTYFNALTSAIRSPV